MMKYNILLLGLVRLTISFVVYPQAFRDDTQRQLSTVTSDVDANDTPLPVVIWHGLGDNYEADGLKELAHLVDEIHPGTYVHIINLAEGSADRDASFFGNVTEQAQIVCQQLASEPILNTAPAIDAIGFSQGGQFLRGYVERCNNPPIRNLLTFGSQHNGISEFQSCAATDWVCKGASALLRWGKWSAFVQGRLVPAQYFRNPSELDQYLEHSNWLADINNERAVKNKTYAKNLATLNKFVMYLFKDDATVIPKESGWFAELNITSEKIVPLRNRTIYTEDWIGLKALDEKNGLVFETLEGTHMQLNDKDLKKAFGTYFGPQ